MPAPSLDAIVECPHGRECGACAYLGQDSLWQLKRKRWTLGEALRSDPALARAQVLPCLASPKVEGYRSRAKMAVSLTRTGGFRVGYFRTGTREVVDAPECRVLLPELLETSQRLRALLVRSPRFPRELRHVDLRCGSDPSRQHLTLVLRTAELPDLPIESLRAACPKLTGLSVNLNPSKGPQVIQGPVAPLWGEPHVHVDIGKLSLRVSPASFFQVNLGLLPEIHRLMRSFLGRGRSLADLYSGVGTHGFALAAEHERVLCIEGIRGAAEDARETAERCGLGHVTVVARPVERSLRELESAAPESVVLNPSRVGAQPRVLKALVQGPVRRIAYLSCDPGTLARDLAFLVRGGFQVVSVQPIDMMPQTRQVEALALLQRQESRRTGPPRGRPRPAR